MEEEIRCMEEENKCLKEELDMMRDLIKAEEEKTSMY